MLSWKSIREAQYYHREQRLARENPIDREMPLERYLSLREAQYLPTEKAEQMEFESITNEVDDREAWIRRKEALARRWFAYYRKCQDQKKKMKLIDQYNFLATTRKERQ